MFEYRLSEIFIRVCTNLSFLSYHFICKRKSKILLTIGYNYTIRRSEECHQKSRFLRKNKQINKNKKNRGNIHIKQ